MKRYQAVRRQKLYIALEDIPDTDFFWDDKEVVMFDILWHRDLPISEIAEILGKTELSVLFLSMDRIIKEKISPRKGWNLW
ncbi:hypothetical protein [Neobacillus sp. 204]|uniref:hypothetical protein n=1 Tax=Neobacillus sp. 204 TaxID=3383351 RepID=UPI0039782757